MTPRLVATDLDGTLVRTDGTISDRTREVLAAVEARGVPVVFVTGRPLRWAEEVFEHVGDHGLAVVSNGALVWDVAADRPRLRREIDPQTVRRVVAELRAAVPGSAFAVETLTGIGLEPAFLERHPVPDGARRASLDELVDGPVVKLLARHEELGPQDYWDAAEAVIGEQVTITWSSTSTLLEISAADVTKASTLALVADGLGVAPGGRARLRRHAQRPADAGLGRHVVRHGQRPPDGAGRGGPRRAAATTRTGSPWC